MKNTHTWENQYELHIMSRMAAPDCSVMCNLINTHTHSDTQDVRGNRSVNAKYSLKAIETSFVLVRTCNLVPFPSGTWFRGMSVGGSFRGV